MLALMLIWYECIWKVPGRNCAKTSYMYGLTCTIYVIMNEKESGKVQRRFVTIVSLLCLAVLPSSSTLSKMYTTNCADTANILHIRTKYKCWNYKIVTRNERKTNKMQPNFHWKLPNFRPPEVKCCTNSTHICIIYRFKNHKKLQISKHSNYLRKNLLIFISDKMCQSCSHFNVFTIT